MIVLDTDVLSEVIRPAPEQSVLDWLDGQESAGIVTTAITAAELRAGVALMPEGRRRGEIGSAVDRLLDETFAHLVLPFDVDCAYRYALIVSVRKAAGHPIGTADAQIAAICLTHGAALATRNTKDFLDTDLAVIDPWRR